MSPNQSVYIPILRIQTRIHYEYEIFSISSGRRVPPGGEEQRRPVLEVGAGGGGNPVDVEKYFCSFVL